MRTSSFPTSNSETNGKPAIMSLRSANASAVSGAERDHVLDTVQNQKSLQPTRDDRLLQIISIEAVRRYLHLDNLRV